MVGPFFFARVSLVDHLSRNARIGIFCVRENSSVVEFSQLRTMIRILALTDALVLSSWVSQFGSTRDDTMDSSNSL